MPQNGIYHEGIATLAESLAVNVKLRYLDLSDNTITAKGAAPLAKVKKPFFEASRKFSTAGATLVQRIGGASTRRLSTAQSRSQESVADTSLCTTEIESERGGLLWWRMEGRPVVGTQPVG